MFCCGSQAMEVYPKIPETRISSAGGQPPGRSWGEIAPEAGILQAHGVCCFYVIKFSWFFVVQAMEIYQNKDRS
jgi:hypothetical protein